MTASDLLRYLILKLEEAGIPYALGGSVASMVYGEPRATLDIDVVVTLGPEAVARLLPSFPSPDFYVDEERMKEVARSGGTFNVIHPTSGLKIDFFAAGDPIEERQIARRIRKEALPGLEAWFSPPEELIVKKLEYWRSGGSDKHARDIRAMLAISPDAVDLDVLDELAERYGLREEWDRVRPCG